MQPRPEPRRREPSLDQSRSSDLSRLSRLPSTCFTSGKRAINFSSREGGNTATGFVPDSHRIPF